MNQRFLRTSLLSLLLTLFAIGTSAQETEYIEHTVTKGQTLYSISHMYGVSVEVLTALNPGSGTLIRQGDRIRIPSSGGREGVFHMVIPGETLYRLGVEYGIRAEDIVRANPGLSISTFKSGQVIFIPSASSTAQSKEASKQVTGEDPSAQDRPRPQAEGTRREDGTSGFKDMHKVRKGETLFSIARKYGVSEDEILQVNPEIQGDKKIKRNTFLRIPYPKQKAGSKEAAPSGNADVSIMTDQEVFQAVQMETRRTGAVKAAVILPFLDASGNPTAESGRMVEYYQGLLMAADSLKKEGVSLEIRTYNSGRTVQDIQDVLKDPALEKMDLLFGPLYSEQITPMADFAYQKGIRMVLPFTSRDNNVFHNPYIYQINTPQSYLYSEVYDHFDHIFPQANVVFMETDAGSQDKADFISGFRQDLQARGKTFTYLRAGASQESLTAALVDSAPNVIVPTTGTSVGLLGILPLIAAVNADTLVTAQTVIFGYPEYQTYTEDHLTDFFENDTYFYSSFYTNNLLRAARDFTAEYRRNFRKEMEDRYPKYGMLGFDTGYFFLRAMATYGDGMERHLQDMMVEPIQTGFKFERVNNWGGFINRKAFFIHFTKDFELIKMDFD